MAPDGSIGEMTCGQMIAHVRAANEVAREAAAHGHHPFGSVHVGPDDRILMRQGLTSSTTRRRNCPAAPRLPIRQNSCGAARW